MTSSSAQLNAQREQGRDSPALALRRFRQKTVRNIYIAATIGAFVLSVVQTSIGNDLLAVILGVAGVVFGWGAWKSRRELLPQTFHAMFVIIAAFATNYSIQLNHESGLYWAYPALSAMFFLFNRRLTVVTIPLVYCSLVGSAWYAMPPGDAWRFAVSLAMLVVLGFTFIVLLSRLQSSMTSLVVTDPLTQLLNRNRVTETLVDNIERLQRYQQPASIIMLDLDHFKILNDNHGHLFGDQLLKQTAKRLLGAVRATDTVFRVGGEEFLVVLPNTDEGAAQRVAAKLIQVIGGRPFKGKDATVELTASAGVAALQAQQSWSQWLSRADQALYNAKTTGRNQVITSPLESASSTAESQPSN